MDQYKDIWTLVLSELSGMLSPGIFKLWFEKMELRYFSERYAFLVMPDKSDEDFVHLVTTRYKAKVEKAFEKTLGFKVDVFIYAARNFSLEGALNDIENKKAEYEEIANNAALFSDLVARDYSKDFSTELDSEYTFDTFVVGSSNKMAHAASIAVARNPAEDFNPLFIYGPSGIGKTHLIKAIANEVKKNNPDFKILFVKGDDFTNELIESIAKKRMSQFKDKYRTVDMLLVDDVQFIAGKISTQEEFFHTINNLFENHKQIILTSDKPPKEIKPLEDRIRTRFEGGLIVDIQPPDTELRIAIFKRKSEIMNVSLSNEVITFICENIQNNTRQIEGVIKKLGAFKFIDDTPITIDRAKELLESFITLNDSPIDKANRIIEQVAEHYGVTADDVRGTKRNKEIAMARHVSIYIIKYTTNLTVTSIGNIFGKDHSTILSSVYKIETELKDDSELNRVVNNVLNDFK